MKINVVGPAAELEKLKPRLAPRFLSLTNIDFQKNNTAYIEVPYSGNLTPRLSGCKKCMLIFNKLFFLITKIEL